LKHNERNIETIESPEDLGRRRLLEVKFKLFLKGLEFHQLEIPELEI
jgi:hypothetical protein